MSAKNIYERFLWFDHKVRSKRYPNTTALSKEFEISLKTAQRDIEFMRDRLRCPLLYDKSEKGKPPRINQDRGKENFRDLLATCS